MQSEGRLSEIQSYSPEQIAEVKSFSPAMARYLNLVEQNNTKDISAQLRLARHKPWLQCALATYFKTATSAEVCLFWSHATDEIVRTAWATAGCDSAGVSIFALGKWGAHELNLSSDIDLIFVSAENPTADQLKKVREFIKLLSENTDHGFAYRVDTDLKPGGRLAPLISSEKQFEDYYWSYGATWERLALVRLRPICGDPELNSRITAIANHFSYRKFLDYSLLEDLRLLRSQIHQHYAIADNKIRNVKLAPGGIRDIELFIHALQIIHGGREKNLRTNSTTDAAAKLVAAHRFKIEDLEYLIKTYWQFRQIENRVQAQNDQQTHLINEDLEPEDFAFFVANSSRVENIVEQVLGQPSTLAIIPSDQKLVNEWLVASGFSNRSIESYWPELHRLVSAQSKSFHDDQLRGRVLRVFIESIKKFALDKDLALGLLTDFFKSIRAKSSFYSLLAHEERLINELSVLFGCSPYLGGVIANRPELLDSLLFRSATSDSKDVDDFLDLLTERRLLSETVAANQFLKTKNMPLLSANLTETADEICISIMQKVAADMGLPPLEILALGKWGGRELGFRSDLDFIFLSQNEPSGDEQKLARRFVSRLTEKHRGGSIYDIDLRLRPSGKGGPILVSRSSLLKYLTTTAEAWERQSYLRARSLTDPHFEKAVYSACVARSISADEITELARIRTKLIKERENSVDIKYNPGGLIDIEFFAQIQYLVDRRVPPSANSFEMLSELGVNHKDLEPAVSRLASSMSELRTIEQLLRLVEEHASSRFEVNSSGAKRVSQLIGASSLEIERRLDAFLSENSTVLKGIDPRLNRK